MNVQDIRLDQPEFQLDPWPIYAQLRANQPVFWSEANKCYFVSRYADIRNILMDQESFGAEHAFRTTRHLFGPTMIDMDGEVHQRIRQTMGKRFKATTVQTVAETIIRPITISHMDRLIGKVRVEVMSDFASSIPTAVILALIGLPVEDAPRVFTTLRPIMRYLDYPKKGLMEALDAADQLTKYLTTIIRKGGYASDLMIGDILHSKGNGGISEVELIRQLLLLLSAGTETTMGTIGNVFACLLQRPHVLKQVQEKPDLLPLVIQETLRYEPPLHTTMRFAKQDIELGGMRIAEGSVIQLLFASGNRDEEMYADAAVWNMHRKEKVNLTFGAGIHNCMGFSLAHKELEIIFTEVFNRFLITAPAGTEPPIITGSSFRCPAQVILELQQRNGRGPIGSMQRQMAHL